MILFEKFTKLFKGGNLIFKGGKYISLIGVLSVGHNPTKVSQ
jgi:hypothetical protein